MDERTREAAITLARRCLKTGLPHETLLVCSKLGPHATRAEPARIGELLHLGRSSEARKATITPSR